MTISVSQPVTCCTSFQVKSPMPGRNIATAATMATRKVSNTGSHVLAMKKVIIDAHDGDHLPLGARLTGPIRRRSS